MKGAEGNKEFLASFIRTAVKDAEMPADIVQLYRSAASNQPKDESNQQTDESSQQKDE